jgi:hypothetical protein
MDFIFGTRQRVRLRTRPRCGRIMIAPEREAGNVPVR